jgi:hypothetical protein
MHKTVAVNERGFRVGEDHQNAKLTNEEVETVRKLHGEGLSYNTLAQKYEVSKTLIAKICRYERRAETASAWKVVHVPEC